MTAGKRALAGVVLVGAVLAMRSGPQPCHGDESPVGWAAIDRDDDWSLLDDTVAAIRRLGEALGEPPVRPR